MGGLANGRDKKGGLVDQLHLQCVLTPITLIRLDIMKIRTNIKQDQLPPSLPLPYTAASQTPASAE